MKYIYKHLYTVETQFILRSSSALQFENIREHSRTFENIREGFLSYYGERCCGNHYTIFFYIYIVISFIYIFILSQTLFCCSLSRASILRSFMPIFFLCILILLFFYSFFSLHVVFYAFLSILYCIIKERTFGIVSTFLHIAFPLQFSKSRLFLLSS